MAENQQNIEQEVQNKAENPEIGPTDEVTTVWHIVLRNNKEYDIVTDWKSLAAAIAAIQDPNPGNKFIGGLSLSPTKLDLKDGQEPILFNFVMIDKSDIVAIEGTF